MAQDWFLDALDRVDRTGRAAVAAIAAGLEQLPPARARHLAGAPLPEVARGMVAEGGVAARHEAMERVDEFERAVMLLRASVAAHLVEDEGLSLSQVGELFGVSRHMVARLLRAVRPDGPVGTSGPSRYPGSPVERGRHAPDRPHR